MLIENFLAEYTIAKRYDVEIDAQVETIYPLLQNLDFGESFLIRGLFLLRRFPLQNLNMAGLLKNGFIFLGEEVNKEVLLGLAGRFWSLSGDLQRLTSDKFQQFQQPGYAKAVWNFSLYPTDSSSTRLSTETRVYCPDEQSRKKFLRYWKFIGPFSGLIRKEILRMIKNKSEKIIKEAYHA